jgi:hypothetical protein
MAKKGMCTAAVRQPLWSMSEENHAKLMDVMAEYEYITAEPATKKAKAN